MKSAKLQDGWQGTNWINEMTKRRTDSKFLKYFEEVKISFTGGLSYFDQDGVLGGNLTDAGYKDLLLDSTPQMVLKG
jgi:hypothetical protein